MPGAVPLLKVVTDVRTTAAAAVAAATVAAAAAAPAAVAAAEVAVENLQFSQLQVHEVAHMLSRGGGGPRSSPCAAGDALGAGLALAVVEGLVVLDARALVELGGGRTEGGIASGRLVGEADG